jgi:hypothetical protein
MALLYAGVQQERGEDLMSEQYDISQCDEAKSLR